MQWETIGQLVRDHRHGELTPLLLELTPAERRAFVAPLKAMTRMPPGEWLPFDLEAGLAVVGAAVLPNASALAPWLRRWSFSYRTGEVRVVQERGVTVEPGTLVNVEHVWNRDIETFRDVTDDIVTLLVAREVDWLPALAHRIAERLPTSRQDHTRFGLVERLLELTGAPPPDTDGYLLGAVTDPGQARPFVERVRTDPRWAALVPRLPEIDGLGGWFAWNGSAEIAALAAQGIVDRPTLLDATVARLQRDGKISETKGFLALHDALRPSVDELTARVRDLLAMLSVTSSAVAQVARDQLMTLDAAGRLGEDDRAEALGHLLRRGEKGVVRDALAWCRAAVQRHPGSAAAVATVAATAFAQPTVDLQRAAVGFVTDHADALGPADRATVLVAAVDLTPDLRRDLETSLGGATSPVDEPVAVLPPAPAPRPFRSYTDPGQLVEGLVGLAKATDAVTVEQVLEASVRWATTWSVPDLRALLRPVLEGHLYTSWARPEIRDSTHDVVVAHAVMRVVAAVVGDPPWGRGRPHPVRESPMQRAVVERIERIADDLRERPGPTLVSTPSDDRGVLAPVDLLDRLTAAARDGGEPWPDDLDDALLRLDRAAAVGPCGADAFAAIGTAAGRVVAERLAAAPPTAAVPVVRVERLVPEHSWMGDDSAKVVERWRLPGPVGSTDRSRHGRTWSTATEPVDASDPLQVWLHWVRPESAPGCWAAALPWHPEVVAASLAPLYASGLAHANPVAGAVIDLASSPGPFGDATALCLALAASAKEVQARAAATDALLLIAADGRLAPRSFGAVLADLLDGGDITVARVLGPLRDATEAGAAEFVWSAWTVVLPRLLRASKPTPKTADVLEVAALAAAATRASGPVEGLADFAARKGNSRQLVEARRLRDLVAG